LVKDSIKHKKSSLLVLLFVGLLSIFGFLYFKITIDPTITFLPIDRSAQWIRYPMPPETRLRNNNILSCLFETSFHIDEIPSRMMIHLKALRRFRIWINEMEVDDLSDQTNWKKGIHLDIKKLVHYGDNKIQVAVENSLGPPALWLQAEVANGTLNSDRQWSVLLLPKGHLVSAEIASDIIPHPISYEGPQPLLSFNSTWPKLSLAFLSSILIFAWYKLLAQKNWVQVLAFVDYLVFRPASILALFIIIWLILFIHNSGRIPLYLGFDAIEHLKYIKYILTHHSLPLPTSGWQMYQPPLFYLLSAVVIKLANLFLPLTKMIYAIKLIPFLSGLGQILISYFAARLVFRDQPISQMIVIVFTALIPMNIYCSHYLSNESLSAFFIGLSLYLTLKIIIQKRSSITTFWLLGMSIGMGLLTKITILLLIPVIFFVLAYSLLFEHRYSAGQICLRFCEIGAGPQILDNVLSYRSDQKERR
jgi:hypothetical protein